MNNNMRKQSKASDSVSSYIDEWVIGSKVDKAIAKANVQSISGEDIFIKLYPGAKRKNGGALTSEYFRYYEKCRKSSGWWVANVNPETEEFTGWGQFKADSGTSLSKAIDKDGDVVAVKYRSPKGLGCEPLCLKVPKNYAKKLANQLEIDYEGESYWEFIFNNKDVPLFITEGAKKAACLISHGIQAVALAGVNNWSVTGDDGIKTLHPTLQAVDRGA